MFERHGTRLKALEYWKKLSAKNRQEIKERIPAYVESTPDKSFRKNFEGWINPRFKRWQNEVVTKADARAANEPATARGLKTEDMLGPGEKPKYKTWNSMSKEEQDEYDRTMPDFS